MEIIQSQGFSERLWDIGTAINHFTSNHPFSTFLASLLLLAYLAGVIWGFCVLFMHVGEPSSIEWLPSIFTTDGILVCCCPLAVILPIIFWPVMLLAVVLRLMLLWFLAAPTYCGIPRGWYCACLQAFVRYPQVCVDRGRQWLLRRREERRRRDTLPTMNQPSPGYGTMHGSGHSVGRYAMTSEQLPSDWSNFSSTWATPPPYRP